MCRWEEVIKEIARHFNTPVCPRCLAFAFLNKKQIHVDRYKRSIYAAIQSDQFLQACTTLDPYISRFHACERRAKCEACRTVDRSSGKRLWNSDKRVVDVNMVEVKDAAWALHHQSFVYALSRAAIGEGPWPYTIVSNTSECQARLKASPCRTARLPDIARYLNSSRSSSSSAPNRSRRTQ